MFSFFLTHTIHTHTCTDEASRVQLALPIALGSEPLWANALWVLLETEAVKSVRD